MPSDVTDDLIEFLNQSPTASHSVALCASMLEEAGFRRLQEGDPWRPAPEERLYTVRADEALVAVSMGSDPPEETGFRIVGAHTDSPGFRLKPSAEKRSHGLTTLAVEVYGGPILATWFDRDLLMAGRIVLREGKGLSTRRFRLQKPLCRIASPAIHLNRQMNKEGFKINRETHLPVIIGGEEVGLDAVRKMAVESCGAEDADVLDMQLELFDSQPATRGGANGELLMGGRIDNLAMCHASVAALMEARPSKPTRVVCLFNSEEVGSRTLNGAASNLAASVLERLCPGREELLRALSRSIQVSADGAHAVHPNWADKHDKLSRPVINGGPVIKINAQQRYTSSADTSTYFRLCAEEAGAEVQHFVSRNDMPCGTTIGPITAAGLGVQSVDAGNPMLSMHSIREMAGALDHAKMIDVLRTHLDGVVPPPASWSGE